LQLSDLRRFKFSNGGTKGKTSPAKGKNGKSGSKNELEELRALQ